MSLCLIERRLKYASAKRGTRTISSLATITLSERQNGEVGPLLRPVKRGASDLACGKATRSNGMKERRVVRGSRRPTRLIEEIIQIPRLARHSRRAR